MKWTLILGLAVLVSLMSRVSSADLGHAENGFQEDDNDMVEKAYRLLLNNGINEEAMDDVLLASWFSHAVNSVKKAAHQVANVAKKGCHYVNQVPFKEFVLRGKEELRRRGMSEEEIDEEQWMAGYQGVKAGCRVLG